MLLSLDREIIDSRALSYARFSKIPFDPPLRKGEDSDFPPLQRRVRRLSDNPDLDKY